LTVEQGGDSRRKADRYFDGTLGKRLVKLAPFNHPLTRLDIKELEKELGFRPEEERDIVLVCLGKETAVGAAVEDRDRLRKRGDVPKRLEVIELRTDPQYGKFFEHKPAQARVSVKWTRDRLAVEVTET